MNPLSLQQSFLLMPINQIGSTKGKTTTKSHQSELLLLLVYQLMLVTRAKLSVKVLPEVVPLLQTMSLPAPTSYLMTSSFSPQTSSHSPTRLLIPPQCSSSAAPALLCMHDATGVFNPFSYQYYYFPCGHCCIHFLLQELRAITPPPKPKPEHFLC